MQQAAIATVAERLALSWGEAAHSGPGGRWGGLRCRTVTPARHIGIDETAFQRRHEYVTIVTDLDQARVLYVGIPGALRAWTPSERSWRPSPSRPSRQSRWSARRGRICSRPTRRSCSTSSTVLRAEGKDWLTGRPGRSSDWLRASAAVLAGPLADFGRFVRRPKLKTGRAWALKGMLMTLWAYRYPGAAARHFTAWYAWAIRSRLEPIKRVARTLRRYWPNIETFFNHRITDARGESMNSRIQKLKVLARVFHNRERFRQAIYFHLGASISLPSHSSLTHDFTHTVWRRPL